MALNSMKTYAKPICQRDHRFSNKEIVEKLTQALYLQDNMMSVPGKANIDKLENPARLKINHQGRLFISHSAREPEKRVDFSTKAV